MKVCKTVAEMRETIATARRAGKTVGLVPTMGALHEGHISLVRRSVADNDVTVVSIFVNPTQFGPNEDLDKYPRLFDDDCRICEEVGVDAIFAPPPDQMYAGDFSTWVEETALSKGLCGAARPGHFRGVTTVVAKLFNIIAPDRAYFGQKDAQQAAVLARMTRDLDCAVEIVVMPIVREADGLAMSSRNAYLSTDQRRQALVLSQALEKAQSLFTAGERDAARLEQAMREAVSGAPDAKVDYIEVVDAETLAPVKLVDRAALAALAVFIGRTRLIDNSILDPEPKGS